MAVDIVMPKLSDTMEQGRILTWHKKEGDFVRKGEVVAEVETDKADMDLEVFSSGVISEIRYREGDTVAVGTVIAVLGGESKKEESRGSTERKESPEEPKQKERTRTSAEESEEPAVEDTQEEGAEGEPCCTLPFDEDVEEAQAAEEKKEEQPAEEKAEKVKLSPAARRLVGDEHIDATELSGSGPGGRIVKEDVEKFLKGRRDKINSRKPAAEDGIPEEPAGKDEIVEQSRMRAAIGKRMTQSKQTTPHFYVTVKVDMGEADRLLTSMNKIADEEGKVTYNDIVIKACGLALREHPDLNAHFTDAGLVRKGNINVGVVVALKVGLLVPVVKNADRKSVKDISKIVRGLRERILNRESTAEDLSGGTFTISNMGMYGVDEFSAIINPPQVAILAVAAVQDVPVMRGSTIHPAKIMKMTLSADHRSVDGVIVARFLQRVKGLLENPVELILDRG